MPFEYEGQKNNFSGQKIKTEYRQILNTDIKAYCSFSLFICQVPYLLYCHLPFPFLKMIMFFADAHENIPLSFCCHHSFYLAQLFTFYIHLQCHTLGCLCLPAFLLLLARLPPAVMHCLTSCHLPQHLVLSASGTLFPPP